MSPETQDIEVSVLPVPRLTETSFASPSDSLSVLTDEGLYAATHVRIAFTNRIGGTSSAPYQSLDLADHVGDLASAVEANRNMLLEALGAGANRTSLIVPNQVHGDTVLVVDDVETTRLEAAEGADAIVCGKVGTPVLLCFADCVSLIMVAPDGTFAVVHAGWRGALAGIAGKALMTLARIAGCRPADCNIYIGPHIGSCCFEVSDEVCERFVAEYGDGCDAGSSHVDLSAAVTISSLRAGAVPERILDSAVCTSCNVDRYYSYRAEAGECGRHGALAFREETSWD